MFNFIRKFKRQFEITTNESQKTIYTHDLVAMHILPCNILYVNGDKK